MTEPEPTLMCPILNLPCDKRLCGWYNPFQKQCSIIGVSNLQNTLWQLLNVFKYKDGSENVRKIDRTEGSSGSSK